jgi:hypothetical protein
VRPSAPLRWSTVDSLYQSAVTRGRDAIFSRLTKDASSGVLCFLGKASALTGARGRDPLLHASVSRQTRLVEFTRRSISALSECLAETLRASAARPVTHAWIPLVLTAGAARHSNCLLLDVQARTATLFEPHGCDPAHEGHAGTDFLRLYDAPSYYSACSTLLEAAQAELPAEPPPPAAASSSAAPDVHSPSAATTAAHRPWTLVAPTAYLPPVFGQSRTRLPEPLPADCPVQRGDPWCALWTLRFLLEATVAGVPAFVQRINALDEEALGREVLSWVHTTYH